MVGFPPQELFELQSRAHAVEQSPQWRRRYAIRAGVEGTICEFTHGHGMRHCRYRGRDKTHVQHVLTAIAVDVERLSDQLPPREPHHPRWPTAFQALLDQQGIPRPRGWRSPGR